jgi:hypothetical protein
MQSYFQETSWTERFGLGVSLVITLALFGAALGPVTHVDSLDYHLGVPLDWLRHAGAYARPDWFHARLAGLGEAINMLGLAMGTDNLGAVFQATGLLVAMIGVMAFATTHSERVFGILCVAACPAILTLSTTQKWQMLPAAGLTVALALVVDRQRQFDHRTALLVFGCIAFAAGSKYSFLLSAGVVGFLGLYVAYRAGRLRTALLMLLVCGTCLAMPVFARNLVFYGDPLSPLLERWRPGGDPAVVAFAQYLRSWSENCGYMQECGRASWQTFLFLPWRLTVSLTPSTFPVVLGIGVLVFILFVRRGRNGTQRLVALAAILVFLLNLALGQLTPRFFLEPYLWCAAAAVPVPSCRLKAFFARALTVQGVLVAAVAVYLGILLFGGALTPAWRDRVMTFMTAGYAEAKWLDAVLPREAVVLENFRSHALMPRRFVVGDRYLMSQGPNREQALAAFIREQKVTMLVVHYPITESLYQALALRYGMPFAGPVQFQAAARSVFNRRKLTGLIVIDINEASLPTRQQHTSEEFSRTPQFR